MYYIQYTYFSGMTPTSQTAKARTRKMAMESANNISKWTEVPSTVEVVYKGKTVARFQKGKKL